MKYYLLFHFLFPGFCNYLFYYILWQKYYYMSAWPYQLEGMFFIVQYLQGAYDKFPDFFRIGTFTDSTHMKLKSPSK